MQRQRATPGVSTYQPSNHLRGGRRTPRPVRSATHDDGYQATIQCVTARSQTFRVVSALSLMYVLLHRLTHHRRRYTPVRGASRCSTLRPCHPFRTDERHRRNQTVALHCRAFQDKQPTRYFFFMFSSKRCAHGDPHESLLRCLAYYAPGFVSGSRSNGSTSCN